MDYLIQIDIIEKILPFLDIGDINSLTETCKELCHLIRNYSDIWVQIIARINEVDIDWVRLNIKYFNIKELFDSFTRLKIGKRVSILVGQYSDAYYLAVLYNWVELDITTWSIYDIITYPDDIRYLYFLSRAIANESIISYLGDIIYYTDISLNRFKKYSENPILKKIYISNVGGEVYITSSKIYARNGSFYPIGLCGECYECLKEGEFFIGIRYEVNQDRINTRLVSNIGTIVTNTTKPEEFQQLMISVANMLNADYSLLHEVVSQAINVCPTIDT